MCKYCGTTNHHKIYESHFGEILYDEIDRTYEIYHIDNNHSNNDLTNLKAVTIQEHYDIHYSQGDYGACSKIAQRMKLTPNEKSRISSDMNFKNVS